MQETEKIQADHRHAKTLPVSDIAARPVKHFRPTIVAV
jgi:hypothetical protein